MSAQLIARATTTRGLLRWAYHACSGSHGLVSQVDKPMLGLMPNPGTINRYDRAAEAGMILGMVKRLRPHYQLVIEAGYGENIEVQSELVDFLVTAHGSIGRPLIEVVVREWCGFGFNMVKVRKALKLTERKIREHREAVREDLVRLDAAAITILDYAFRERGWVE